MINKDLQFNGDKMDIEKYTNGKLYQFFEILFRLVVWNLLTLLIVGVVMAGPFLGFYYLREGTFAGVLMLIGVLLGFFFFIPSYCTIFSCIKLYKEDKSCNTFIIYFEQFWDNLKSLYKMELIIFPVVILFSFAMYFYYAIIGDEELEITLITSIYQIGYTILLFAMVGIFLCFLNLPMTVGYFRMKTKTIMKFTLIMTFKHILKTIIFALLFIMPIIIVILVNSLIPVWLLIGFSLPLYIIYYMTHHDYWRLVNNINIVRDEEVYLQKGEEE